MIRVLSRMMQNSKIATAITTNRKQCNIAQGNPLLGEMQQQESVDFSGEVKQTDRANVPEEYHDPDAIRTNLDVATARAKGKRKTRKSRLLVLQDLSMRRPISCSSTSVERQTSRSYLRYLTEHYTTRARWKFNKNLQTQLLQNIFDTHRVPETLQNALEGYIFGLQGKTARAKLRVEAENIVAENIMMYGQSTSLVKPGPNHTSKSAADTTGLDRDVNSDFDVAKLARAKAILDVLTRDPSSAAPGSADSATLKQALPDIALVSKLRGTPKTGRRRSRGYKRRQSEPDPCLSCNTSVDGSEHDAEDAFLMSEYSPADQE